MADFDNSQSGPILADDLTRDRSRQFTEFLDDQVRIAFLKGGELMWADQAGLQLPRVYQADAGR